MTKDTTNKQPNNSDKPGEEENKIWVKDHVS